MALQTLPKELLLMVTDYLPPSSLESLALTFNKDITATCLPLLQPLFARRRHAKRMISRFGDYTVDIFCSFKVIKQHRDRLGVSPTAELSEPNSSERLQRLERLEYLNLKEDLHWLQPLDEETAEESRYNGHQTLTTKELEALQEDANSVGVTVPPSFLKLFSDKALQDRIPSTTSCYFNVKGGLRKVPAAVDNGAGGYSISMYADQQGCYYWTLYLEPGPEGSHCILGTDTNSGEDWDQMSEDDKDVYSATKEERECERDMATMEESDISLRGIGFEEWLAMIYFEEWLSFIDSVHGRDQGELEEELKEYVRRMYVREER